MLKKIFNFYNDLNMRYKLFITYLLLILLPFAAFIIMNNYAVSKDLKTQALFSSRQVFEYSRSYIEYKIEIVKTYMDVISLNDKIQEIIKKDPKVYEENYGLWGYDLNEITKQFINSKPSIDIVATRLYLNGSITVIDETDDFQKISKVSNTGWYKKLLSSNNSFEWFNSSYENDLNSQEQITKYISVVRKIQNNESLRDVIGLARVDIPESTFKTLLDHAAFFKSSSLYLVDNSDKIICTSSSAPDSHYITAPDILKKYSPNRLQKGVWDNLKLDNVDYLVGIQNVKGTSWNMIITIPYAEILSSQSKTMRQMLLIILIVAPFMFPLAYFGASSGTKRIRKLITTMRAAQNGDFNIDILPSSKDEIGELTRTFNIMLTKISMLMDEEYKLGQEIKSIELKALQAQINPHFLYNTLDLIYWKAVRIKEQSIYDLVQSLSKFYKLSLSKGNDIVTLENELDHVKAYIEIQNARFKNGITFIIDIPEYLYQYKLPKITLQPIIENSIIHGILETQEEKGTIKITGYTKGNKIIIEVNDDGVGIPGEKLVTILETDSNDTFHGYGINNIDKRIKLLCGKDCGLYYTSTHGVGTTVKIILSDLI